MKRTREISNRVYITCDEIDLNTMTLTTNSGSNEPAHFCMSNISCATQFSDAESPPSFADMVVCSVGPENTAIFTSQPIKDAMDRAAYPIGVPVYEWSQQCTFNLHNTKNSPALTMSAYKARPGINTGFDGFAHQGSHILNVAALFSTIFEKGDGRPFISKTHNTSVQKCPDTLNPITLAYQFIPTVNFSNVVFEGPMELQSMFTRTSFKTPSASKTSTLILSQSNMHDGLQKALHVATDPDSAFRKEVGENTKAICKLFSADQALWKDKKVNELTSDEMNKFMSAQFCTEECSVHMPEARGFAHGPLKYPIFCYNMAINAHVGTENSPTNGAQQLAFGLSHCGNLPEINMALRILNADSKYAIGSEGGRGYDYVPGRRCLCRYNEGCNLPKIKSLIDVGTGVPCVGAMTCLRDIHRHAIGTAPMLQAMGKYSSDMFCLGNRINQDGKYNEVWTMSEDMAAAGHLVQGFAFKFNQEGTKENSVEFHSAYGNDDCESATSIACVLSQNIFSFGNDLINGETSNYSTVLGNLDPLIQSNIKWVAETLAQFQSSIHVNNCFGLTLSPSVGKAASFENVDMNCEISTSKFFKDMKQRGKNAAKVFSGVGNDQCNFAGTAQLGGHSFSLMGLKIDGNEDARKYARFLFTFGEHTGGVTPVHCCESVNVETVLGFGKTNTIPGLTTSKLMDTNLAKINFKGLPQTFCQLFKNQLAILESDKPYTIQNMMIMNIGKDVNGGSDCFYSTVVSWAGDDRGYVFVSKCNDSKNYRPGITLGNILNQQEGIPVIPPGHLEKSAELPDCFMVPMFGDSPNVEAYKQAWHTIQSLAGQARMSEGFRETIFKHHYPQMKPENFTSAGGYRGMLTFMEKGPNGAVNIEEDIAHLQKNWKGMDLKQNVIRYKVPSSDHPVNSTIVYTELAPQGNDKYNLRNY